MLSKEPIPFAMLATAVYPSPSPRRPKLLVVYEIRELCRWFCRAPWPFCTFVKGHGVLLCPRQHRQIVLDCYCFRGRVGSIILLRLQKTRLRRVRRKTRFGGHFPWALIGKKIADVESSRNVPIRWDGDVIRVGVDFATDSERARGASMELVHALRGVLLGMEPDHDHASLLELVRAAMGV